VLVRCYHGLGDTVQFIRFAAPLRKIAAEVIVWAQPPLVALLRTAEGVDRVLPLHDGTPDVASDCDIEIMELAHALRVDARSIPRTVPYLFPPNPEDAMPASGGELKIGLVWCAGDWDPERSLPAELLSPLACLSGVRLLSLQCGSAAAESRFISAQDVGSYDIDRTAARLRRLDLLISVDTFPAHLAGALGIPVWLLLKAQCDWRWMEHCTHTVWYPTMRLFRQPRSSDWPPVIAEITRELKTLRRSRVRKDLEQTSSSDVRIA
jgi:hypothetical protein